MRSSLFTVFFFIMLTPVWGQSDWSNIHEAFDKKDYHDTKNLVQDIIKRYPPHEYYYVGVGRSPAPIIEVMNAAGIEGASELPLSGSKHLPLKNVTGGLDRQKQVLEHLGRYLPDSKILAGKKIVLLDYAYSGEGLTNATEVVDWYLKQKSPGTSVDVMAVTDVNNDQETIAKLKTLEKKGHRVEIVRGRYIKDLATKMYNQSYEFHTKYRSFKLYTFSSEDQPKNFANPEYKLKEHIQKFVKEDPLPLNVQVCEAPTSLLPEGLSLANTFFSIASFLPTQNPYAEVVGLECEELKKLQHKVKCEWDSYLNPFNHQVICTEVLDYWTIKARDGQKTCATRTRIYAFDASREKTKFFLESQGLFDQGRSSDAFLQHLKSHLATKIEVEEKVFPDSAVGTYN